MHHEARDGESENGGGVRHGAVDLRLAAAPFMADEFGVLEFRFAVLAAHLGAHAGGGPARGIFATVFQEFVAVNAQHFFLERHFLFLEFIAECAGERASGHFPEFGDLDARGVHLEGGPHRGEYGGLRARGVPQQLHLVFEAIDGIDDIVECIQLEFFGIRFFVNVLQRYDVCVRVDFEQAFLEDFYLHLADGLGGGHQLAVHVGDAHAVGIYEHEFLDAAAAHEAFGAPAADSAEPEDDDALFVDVVHHVVPEQERCAVEYAFLDTHKELCEQPDDSLEACD